MELATPRVHIRVGAERSTAVQHCIVCKISRTAGLSSVWTMSPKHNSALTLTWQEKKLFLYQSSTWSTNPKKGGLSTTSDFNLVTNQKNGLALQSVTLEKELMGQEREIYVWA